MTTPAGTMPTDAEIESFAEAELGDGSEPLDMDRFLLGIETAWDVYLPESYDDPLIKRIARIARRVQRDLRAS